MKAFVIASLSAAGGHGDALVARELPVPVPGPRMVRIRVTVCGVCHTELDEIDGRTPPTRVPRVPGHQVVGVVDAVGEGVEEAWLQTRVGVAWIFRACGVCTFCVSGRENLCERFEATGRDADGGYAEFMVAPVEFVFRLPPSLGDESAAPLLCAGAIGTRSLRLTHLTDGQVLGLTGFGASAHLVLMMARRLYPSSPVFVFARGEEDRAFARALGAAWAGDTAETPPDHMHAVIDTTPAWRPVVCALEHLVPGGRLVINAIRKADADKPELLHLDYARHLWMEKTVQSVANVTRADVQACLDLAASMPLHPSVTLYALDAANAALADLRAGRGHGAKVLRVA
jgi:alcohol dehydrogenase, propanol-preferring